MAYSTGSITLTNGQKSFSGTGTAWNSVGLIRPGYVLELPGGKFFRIEAISSDTAGTLEFAYEGSSGTFSTYAMFSISEVKASQSAQIAALIDKIDGGTDAALAGKFPNGTLAQPGLRFTADEDNGLRRIGSNNWSAVVGGVDRMRFHNAGAKLDGLLTGTAVTQSITDTTEGRLTKVGDFGVGATVADGPDLDLSPLGFSRFTTNDTNKPVGNSAGVVITSKWSSTNAKLQLCQTFFPSTHEGILFTRYIDPDGVPTTWNAIFSRNNILGTVSQSGGVPTGLVIERGSNANGEYVRFADGTQICNFNVTSSLSAAVTWTFPAAFFSTSMVPAFVNTSESIALSAMLETIATSSLSFSVRNTSNARVATFTRIHVIGRWF